MSDAARPSAPPPAAAPYEFCDEHKDTFRALAASMSFVGVCAILFGGLVAVLAIGELYAGLVTGAIAAAVGAATCIVLAWWTVSAGRSLSALTCTRGRDVDHLMAAVLQLRHLFAFARVVIVAVTMLVMVCAGGFVWCTVVADRGGKCFGFW